VKLKHQRKMNKVVAKKGVVAHCEQRRQNKRPKEFASADFVP
jgi:hypothetical protein